MTSFSVEVWGVIGIIGAAGVLTFLNTLAHAFECETKLHQLKIQVSELKLAYAKRLAEYRGESSVIYAEPIDGPASPPTFPVASGGTEAQRMAA